MTKGLRGIGPEWSPRRSPRWWSSRRSSTRSRWPGAPGTGPCGERRDRAGAGPQAAPAHRADRDRADRRVRQDRRAARPRSRPGAADGARRAGPRRPAGPIEDGEPDTRDASTRRADALTALAAARPRLRRAAARLRRRPRPRQRHRHGRDPRRRARHHPRHLPRQQRPAHDPAAAAADLRRRRQPRRHRRRRHGPRPRPQTRTVTPSSGRRSSPGTAAASSSAATGGTPRARPTTSALVPRRPLRPLELRPRLPPPSPSAPRRSDAAAAQGRPLAHPGRIRGGNATGALNPTIPSSFHPAAGSARPRPEAGGRGRPARPGTYAPAGTTSGPGWGAGPWASSGS